MRYILINASPGNMQVNLFSPDQKVNHRKLNRNGPIAALSIKRGCSVNILPYFDNNIERAHAALKHSRDVLGMWKPNRLRTRAYDDNNNIIDIDALLSGKSASVEEPKVALPVDDPPADDTPADDPPADDTPADETPTDETPTPASDSAPDNMTVLKYVGEALEQKLYDAGLITYSAVAEADLDMLKELIGPKHKEVQEQAKELVK